MVITVELTRTLAALAVIALLPLTACAQTTQTGDAGASNSPAGVGSDGCVTQYDANADYFPDKTSFSQATGVTVEYHGSYKTVTVKEPVKGASPETYVLVQCGANPELPSDLASAQRITIPVHRAATSSTTQLPAFELLKATDSLAAVESPAFVWSDPITKLIADGKIVGFGNESGGINVEALAAATPDLFFSSGMPDPAYDKIRELKIPVVGNAEWLENTPLGRAEWLKFTALFTNTESTANQVFQQIETDYSAVKDKVQQTTERPTAIVGAPFNGEWSRPGGRSYVAAFLADAGMTYVFADDESNGSNPTPIETMLEAGARADIWVNADMMKKWATVSAIGADDPRLATVKAAQDGRVYNPTKRINAAGGNDYWQQGVVRPDLVLRDLAKAAHPDLFADQDYVFYEQLPA
jgi:ABC transporter, substrate-binding protein